MRFSLLTRPGLILSLLLAPLSGRDLEGVSGKVFQVERESKSFVLLKETELDPKTNEGSSRVTVVWNDKTEVVVVKQQRNLQGIEGRVKARFSRLDERWRAAIEKGEAFRTRMVRVYPAGHPGEGWAEDESALLAWLTPDSTDARHRKGTVGFDGRAIPFSLPGPNGAVEVITPGKAELLSSGFFEARVWAKDQAGRLEASRLELFPKVDPRTIDDPKLPRVLVVGDSISMNYHDAAKAKLQGVANYHRVEGNAGPSDRGVSCIELWLGNYREKGLHWDLIQFNHGLHDLKQFYDKETGKYGKHQISIEQYQENLEKEIAILKKTGATLMWCSTTPVPNNSVGTWDGVTMGRRKDEELVFNKAALEVVKRHPDILINDLNAAVREAAATHPEFADWNKGTDVHFWRRPEQEVVGQAVAREIKGALDHRARRKRPNFIMVFIDDMGFSDFSCFGGDVRTEQIDALAAEGIRFTSFYVNSPICSPSRVALTTGQYPFRWRVSSYLASRKANRERGLAQWLDPAAPVLARRLQEFGYATGHFGKWHMGGQRDVADAPPISMYGFDRSLTNFEGMGPKLLPLTLKPNPDGGDPIEGRIWADAERLGEGAKWMQRSEITSGFVSAALDFIDDAREQKKPFYLNLWPDDVHSPFWPPLDKWGGSRRALYEGVLDSMDEQLARLFAKVRDDPELRNNTVIMVCSDNGHEPGAGRSEPFRGAKTWLYEGGIRSPLIVWAPGLMRPESIGTVNDRSVFCALDLNRSLYALAGLAPTEELDGEDLSGALVGESQASRQAPVFWRRPPDRPGFGHGFNEDNPDLAVREGDWKYLVNFDGSAPQLYHLREDPSESRNVAESHPDLVTRLDRLVHQWNGRLPVDAGDPAFRKPALPRKGK
jgi:uncharacterized sulfatase